MDDGEIVELFWQRSELALSAIAQKYSKYCHAIAFNILQNNEDAEECVSDTLVRAWDAIPPARPAMLRTYLGKITRNLSISAFEKKNAAKRGLGQVPLILSELEECVSATYSDVDSFIEEEMLIKAINTFLGNLEPMQRKVFVHRYWYASSIEEIAGDYKLTIANVKSILFMLRKKLRILLEKEGITL